MARGNPNPSPATRFKPGNNGRPTDSRDRLSRAFLLGLADSFEKHGIKAIETVRKEDPSTYLRVVAALQPKEIKIERPLGEMDDGKLLEAIETLTEAMRSQAPPPAGASKDERVLQ